MVQRHNDLLLNLAAVILGVSTAAPLLGTATSKLVTSVSRPVTARHKRINLIHRLKGNVGSGHSYQYVQAGISSIYR